MPVAHVAAFTVVRFDKRALDQPELVNGQVQPDAEIIVHEPCVSHPVFVALCGTSDFGIPRVWWDVVIRVEEEGACISTPTFKSGFLESLQAEE